MYGNTRESLTFTHHDVPTILIIDDDNVSNNTALIFIHTHTHIISTRRVKNVLLKIVRKININL